MILSDTNRKIVAAVIKKCEQEFPGALALISVHGSVLTGDTHKGSDLDLNIVMNDDSGRGLSSCFILEDTGIGYDLYCTSWGTLETVAECRNPYISRLMDGEILYVSNEEAKIRFLSLRKQAAEYLVAPFSKNDLDIIEAHMTILKDCYFKVMTADKISKVRYSTAWVIQEAIEAVMAANKKYFRRGVRRTFMEMRNLDLPKDFIQTILGIVRETDIERIKKQLTEFVREVNVFFNQYRLLTAEKKAAPTKEKLSGTYEEMISNWHKKVREAAEHNDPYAALMAIAFMEYMRNEEICAEIDIEPQDVMACFHPMDLAGTFRRFEEALEDYQKEYEKIGLPVRSYSDIDAFVRDYLKEGRKHQEEESAPS